MVFLETPTNPVMRLTDIAAVAALTQPRGMALVVDNTFASPCLQRPLALGADIVVHSTTKYLNGHSDSVGGIVVCVRDEHIEWLKFVQNAAGSIMGPFDAWLVLRGTKTLAVRMERHNTNGLAVAQFLAGHPKVSAVHYPGLASHSQHALASRQMRGFGGMLAFDVDTLDRARVVLERFKVFALAESLGGVESLACHPASMTHASVPVERRAQIGLTESMVRLSVGIEDINDLLADVAQALDGLA
jgi:cystathionine beta-lyase/cystathionine gamma-synthase